MAIIATREDIRAAGTQDWHLDNTALKSIRFQGENPPGTPLDWSGVDLTHSDPYLVLTIRRDKGSAYSMVEPQQPWSWRKMLNRFDDDTLTRIIGPGVTGIFCQPMLCLKRISERVTLVETSYDYKRCLSGAGAGPVWDFVIHRGDGERVRLHPNQTNKKVSISMMGAPIPTATDGPQAGFQEQTLHDRQVENLKKERLGFDEDTRGDGADWRGWQDWRGAWSSDDHPRSAWSSDGAWHAWSSDDIDNWRGAWNSDDNWRGAWNSDDNWRGAPTVVPTVLEPVPE